MPTTLRPASGYANIAPSQTESRKDKEMTRIEMFAAAALVAGAAFSAEPGFTDLFDGKTLDGWKTNGGSAEYHVEDGVIAGVGVPGTPGNTFLCTAKEYENFIFKAEFKCPSGNSGIQFRSSTVPAP